MTPDTSTPGQNTPLPEFSEPEPGYSYTQPLRNNYESEILERKPAIDLSTGRMYWNIQDQREGKHIIILPDRLFDSDRSVCFNHAENYLVTFRPHIDVLMQYIAASSITYIRVQWIINLFVC